MVVSEQLLTSNAKRALSLLDVLVLPLIKGVTFININYIKYTDVFTLFFFLMEMNVNILNLSNTYW